MKSLVDLKHDFLLVKCMLTHWHYFLHAMVETRWCFKYSYFVCIHRLFPAGKTYVDTPA